MIKKYWKLIALMVLAMVITGCGREFDVNIDGAKEVGFWAGLWDGMTVWVAFIGNLFGADWAVYDVVNKGALYDLGFVLGVGGSTSCACNSRR